MGSQEEGIINGGFSGSEHEPPPLPPPSPPPIVSPLPTSPPGSPYPELASNHHTYVYEPERSLRHLTVEVLPLEDNYQKIVKDHIFRRPTVDELMVGKKADPPQDEESGQLEVKKGKIVKFGWLDSF